MDTKEFRFVYCTPKDPQVKSINSHTLEHLASYHEVEWTFTDGTYLLSNDIEPAFSKYLQYIGKKDQSGKKIFEDDIVNIKRNDKWHRGKIAWSETNLCWFIECDYGDRHYNGTYGIRFHEITSIEVI